jgi:hypothetical protein
VDVRTFKMEVSLQSSEYFGSTRRCALAESSEGAMAGGWLTLRRGVLFPTQGTAEAISACFTSYFHNIQ